jgi:hypothetical protein
MEYKSISTRPHGFVSCTIDIGVYFLDGKPTGGGRGLKLSI